MTVFSFYKYLKGDDFYELVLETGNPYNIRLAGKIGNPGKKRIFALF